MDFSEKDAARSKWKLTQRHRRGRGAGRGGAGRGGRGGRGGGSAAAAQDLGSNADRCGFGPFCVPQRVCFPECMQGTSQNACKGHHSYALQQDGLTSHSVCCYLTGTMMWRLGLRRRRRRWVPCSARRALIWHSCWPRQSPLTEATTTGKCGQQGVAASRVAGTVRGPAALLLMPPAGHQAPFLHHRLLRTSQSCCYCCHHRCRARVNLAQDVGLPPESAEGGYQVGLVGAGLQGRCHCQFQPAGCTPAPVRSCIAPAIMRFQPRRAAALPLTVRQLPSSLPQGLSFDLRGLATCLELVPKNRLLDTDAFSEEEEDGSSWWGSNQGDLPDMPPDEEQDGLQGEQPAGTSGAVEVAAGAAAAGVLPAAGAAAQPAAAATAQPAAAAAASAATAAARGMAAGPAGQPTTAGVPSGATAAEANVADLLSELLGEQATISAASSAQQQAQQSAPAAGAPVPGRQQRQHTPAASAALAGQGGQPPAAPRLQQLPPAPPLQPQHVQPPSAAAAAAAEEHDDELDMLLGMAAGKPAAAAPPGSSGGSAVAPAPQSQSLEDWLEGL